MDYKGKNKNRHFGLWFECFLLVAVPVALYVVFLLLFGNFFPLRKELNEISARVLGFGLGSVYHASCSVAGAFDYSREAIKFRIRNFVENLEYSVKIAAKGYIYDLKEEGIDYWIYLAIMAACAAVALTGLYEYFGIIGIIG